MVADLSLQISEVQVALWKKWLLFQGWTRKASDSVRRLRQCSNANSELEEQEEEQRLDWRAILTLLNVTT